MWIIIISFRRLDTVRISRTLYIIILLASPFAGGLGTVKFVRRTRYGRAHCYKVDHRWKTEIITLNERPRKIANYIVVSEIVHNIHVCRSQLAVVHYNNIYYIIHNVLQKTHRYENVTYQRLVNSFISYRWSVSYRCPTPSLNALTAIRPTCAWVCVRCTEYYSYRQVGGA